MNGCRIGNLPNEAMRSARQLKVPGSRVQRYAEFAKRTHSGLRHLRHVVGNPSVLGRSDPIRPLKCFLRNEAIPALGALWGCVFQPLKFPNEPKDSPLAFFIQVPRSNGMDSAARVPDFLRNEAIPEGGETG